MIAAALLALAPLAAGGDDDAYYVVDSLVPPGDARVEVGGLGFLPDGRLAVSTRRGQVWLVENPLADDPLDARWSLFCEGLQEGLGLAVVDGELYVLQRAELSRLVDEDKDGVCDRVDTVSDDWGVSGHYHEFAFGLPRDADGDFFVSLNVSFGDPQWWHGRSVAPYRGWLLRIGADGRSTPYCSGLRSPCGLGFNAAGDLFVTDNQGDWMAACPIFHAQPGRFFGHPASLNWTEEYRAADRIASDTVPPEVERAPAACWIPYDWSRSAGNLVPDTTGGAFGPFAGQMFVAELTNGHVLRADLELVGGEYQGAVFPFRREVGSAVRVAFGPDGTLFVGRTERGWGGQAPGDGLGRVRWTGTTPMEILHMRLVDGGFELEFTQPLAEELTPDRVQLSTYDYDYWWEYGSPVRHLEMAAVAEVRTSADRRKATLSVPGLEAGKVARLALARVTSEDGQPLRNPEAAYTINRLVGDAEFTHVAKLVPPPTARERWEEGILMLMRGDPLDAWSGDGWAVRDVEPAADDRSRLAARLGEDGEPRTPEPGEAPVVTNAFADHPQDLVSDVALGDIDMYVEFQLPERGESGLFLMGRYEVQLFDSSGREELQDSDLGGLRRGRGDANAWDGRAPNYNAFRGAGEWHGLGVKFIAPRFDADGNKVSNARFVRVMIDDVLLQDEVEVPNPTAGAPFSGEAPLGPLVLQGTGTDVAFRNLRVLDRSPARSDEPGWVPLFDGETLDGWEVSDGGTWVVEDGAIVGSGPRSHLFSPRDDYEDFELRAKVRINDGGNSGLYFRTAFGPGWPEGYEAQVNSTFSDPVKTGSVYGLAPVLTQMITPDTWFDYHVTCRDEGDGTRIVVSVNGIVVNDVVDGERRHARGHVALQQHHEGSVVHVKDLEIRELPR